MYKKILVPTDGSALSEKAVVAAVQYAKVHPGTMIIGMTVVEPFQPFQLPQFSSTLETDYMLQERNRAEHIMKMVAEQAKVAGVPLETLIVESSRPFEEIVRAAEDHDCDCIFMASNGRKGLHKLFIGSETKKVLSTASVPVMVYR
jgi:nucleotide-binding universal stress UspA family protein